jgi:LAO/AO transport system kinase
VAIVAVDPSSPFTGGALLGDRIRMRDLAGDPGVFIRSMASRGALGGLARTTSAVVEALDAAGFDAVLIETVGAGQTEVDIARTAHTTLVVEAPGMGDEIQALKAGILEAADIVIVNKADLPGADQTRQALKAAMSMAKAARASGWQPPILSTVATAGEGIPEVAEAIARHQAHLRDTGEWQRRERERIRLLMEDMLQRVLVERFLEGQADERFDRALERVLRRELAPAQAVRALIEGEPL